MHKKGQWNSATSTSETSVRSVWSVSLKAGYIWTTSSDLMATDTDRASVMTLSFYWTSSMSGGLAGLVSQIAG